MKNIPYLDGLRGVAILMVFLIHSGGFGLRSFGYLGNSLVDHGKYGVTVFFVASAYVLTAQISEKPLSWRAFYLRRFMRIAPMYFLVLSLAISIRPMSEWPSVGSVIAHISFLNIFVPRYANDILSVEWSIAVEVAFYALFPIVMVIYNRSLFSLALLAFVLALPGLRNTVYEWIGGDVFEYRHYTLPWHAYAFLAGVLAYRARDVVGARGVILASLAILVALILSGEGQWSGPAVALATALIIHDAHHNGAAFTVLSSKPLMFIGKISYSFYLTHMLLISTVGPLLALPATVGLSYASWLYVEEPFRRLARLAKT